MPRIALILLALLPGPLRAQDGTQLLDTVSVAERFLYGPDVTVGIAFNASFLTAEARAEALDLRQELGSYEGHTMLLGDLLLDLSLDGLGFNASWRIIGPAALVEGYFIRLRKLADARDGIHSMDTHRFAVLCACD